MDKVRALSMTDGNGFFVDLTDCPCAYSVTPNEGTIQINHIIRASIPGEKISGFDLEPEGNDWLIVVRCEFAGESTKIPIGTISDEETARCWIERVNKLYNDKQKVG